MPIAQIQPQNNTVRAESDTRPGEPFVKAILTASSPANQVICSIEIVQKIQNGGDRLAVGLVKRRSLHPAQDLPLASASTS